MKKGNVTLAALLPLIGGYQKIRIEDRQELYVEPTEEIIYEGYSIDLKHDTLTDDQKKAKVISVKAIKDVMIISICTTWEAKGML
jgi:hypothetical protein